jgi:hypothetical protein
MYWYKTQKRGLVPRFQKGKLNNQFTLQFIITPIKISLNLKYKKPVSR